MRIIYKSKALNTFFCITFPLIILGGISCKKFVEINAPVTSVNENNVFLNDVSATAVLTGIYIGMSTESSIFTGRNGISFFGGLSADELTLHNTVSDSRMISYYQNGLSVLASTGSEYWSSLFSEIAKCNAAIEGLNKSTILRASVKQQLLGEAKFLRAFFYFYVVNLFGDAPLAITTDYKLNAAMGRSSTSEVYQQIILDLKDAESLLDVDYLDGSLKRYGNVPERVRPTKWAATALLARVYLYAGSGYYAKAETEATAVINNTSFYSLAALNDVFLKNSNEAIWQLQPVTPNHNTEEALLFIIPSSGPDNYYWPAYLDSNLLKEFESDDLRKNNWVGGTAIGSDIYYYPYKYKSASYGDPVSEYLMVLRLAEQYLIRAEARAQQNDISGAQSDLNAIRSRAGLSNTMANDISTLLNAIWKERRLELFTEWGNRWLDLKRTNNINSVMETATALKGGIWNNYQLLYPLPLSDIQMNPNLVQNPGY